MDGTETVFRFGPMAEMDTVYETPDGRQCMLVWQGTGNGRPEPWSPIKDGGGALRVGYLVDGQPARDFRTADFDWVAAECLKPVGVYEGDD